MRKNRSRFNTDLLPQGEGEFNDTGCHTPEGNNLCLYVDTTRQLFDQKVLVFNTILEQKKRWWTPRSDSGTTSSTRSNWRRL